MENRIILLILSPILIIFSFYYMDKRTIYALPLISILILSFNLLINNEELLFIFSGISLIFLTSLFTFLVDKSNRKELTKSKISFLFFILSYWLIIIFLFSIRHEDYLLLDLFLSTLSITIIYIVYFLFFSLLLKGTEVIYNNISNLENSITKDSMSFYKIALYKEKLLYYISDNNVEVGALALFEFTPEILKSIDKDSLLEYLQKELSKKYKNIIFLRVYSKTQAFFISFPKSEIDLETISQNNNRTNRTKDILSGVDEFINSINFNGKKINIGVSLFGIHSSDIDNLSLLSNNLLEKVKRKEKIQLLTYSYRKVYETIEEKEIISRFLHDNFKVKFYEYPNKDKIFYTEYKINYQDNLYKNINFNDLSLNENRVIGRYLSLLSIKKFYSESNKSEVKLIINYPIEFLVKEKINISRFINKIEKYTSAKNIIIGIDLKKNEINDRLIENIDKLQENNFSIAILNADKKNQNIYKNLMPKYIIKLRKEKFLYKYI